MHPRRFTVRPAENGESLLDFLAGKLNLSKKKAKQLLDDRRVFVNGRRIWMARHALESGDEVEAHVSAESRAPRILPILYEDADVVVVNKPAGVLANGPDSLETFLQESLKTPSLAAVHRLDRDTTGCLLFARHETARRALVSLFEGKEVHKTYHAIVVGRVPPGTREIAVPIDGKTARSRLTVLSANRQAGHLRVNLETGRTHQIRKHLLAIHHPLAGDKEYAGHQPLPPVFRTIPRQMLHAAVLSFPHPAMGTTIRVEAALPPDFRMCLSKLGLT